MGGLFDEKSCTFCVVLSSVFGTYLYTMYPVGRGAAGELSASFSGNWSEGGK